MQDTGPCSCGSLQLEATRQKLLVHRRIRPARLVSPLALALVVSPLCAQLPFSTKLKPRTVREFDQYAQTVEQQLSTRWQGKRPFLSVAELRSDQESVL